MSYFIAFYAYYSILFLLSLGHSYYIMHVPCTYECVQQVYTCVYVYTLIFTDLRTNQYLQEFFVSWRPSVL